MACTRHHYSVRVHCSCFADNPCIFQFYYHVLLNCALILATSIIIQLYFISTSIIIQLYFISTSIIIKLYFISASIIIKFYFISASIIIKFYFIATSIIIKLYFTRQLMHSNVNYI